MVMELLIKDLVLCLIIIVFTMTFLYQWRRQPHLPTDIPYAGHLKIPFSRHLARFRILLHGRALLEESYYKVTGSTCLSQGWWLTIDEQFSKANRPCVLPSVFGSHIVLPPSMIPWMINQPESVLSGKHAQIDAMEATHTMLRPELVLQPAHEAVIQRDLKNHLNELVPDIQDEISRAVDEIWGLERESFTMINLDKTIREIVTRASNRAFIGLPLCEYLSSASCGR